MPAGTNPLAFLAAASSTARKPEVPTDAKANNTVGFYAKAVVTLDKEPPRRKGLDTSGLDGLTAIDMKNLAVVFKALGGAFADPNGNEERPITAESLERKLISLGYAPEKLVQYGCSEVEQMIWEVDDDGDGCVSWDEFVTLYRRSKADRTGNEPTQLFHVTQFMCMDKNQDGLISPEEFMEVVILRHGRSTLDQLFVNDDRMDDMALTDFLLRVRDVARIPFAPITFGFIRTQPGTAGPGPGTERGVPVGSQTTRPAIPSAWPVAHRDSHSGAGRHGARGSLSARGAGNGALR